MPPIDNVTQVLSQVTSSSERLVLSETDGEAQDASLDIQQGKKGPRLGSHFVKSADHKDKNRAVVSAFTQRLAQELDEDVAGDVGKALKKTVKKGRSLTGRRLQNLVKPTLLASIKKHATHTKIVASLSRSQNNGELDVHARAALKHAVDNIDNALPLAPNAKAKRALQILKADIKRDLGEASEDPRAAFKPTKDLLKKRRGILIATDPSATKPNRRLAIKPDLARSIAAYTPSTGDTGRLINAARTIVDATGLQLALGGIADERIVELAGEILRGDFSGVLARKDEVQAQSTSALGQNVERAEELGSAIQRRGSVVLNTAETDSPDEPVHDDKPQTVYQQKAARIAQFVSNLQQGQPISAESVKTAFLENPEGLIELIISRPSSTRERVPTQLPALWQDAGVSRELGVALQTALTDLKLTTLDLGYDDISLAGRQQTISTRLNALDKPAIEAVFGSVVQQLSSETRRTQNDELRSLAAELVAANATAQNPGERQQQLSRILQNHEAVLEKIRNDPSILQTAGFDQVEGQPGLASALEKAANLIAIPGGAESGAGVAYSEVDIAGLSTELNAAVQNFDFNRSAGLNLLTTVSDAIPDQGYFTAYLADVFKLYGESLNALDKALLLSAHLSDSNPADGELGALKGTIKGAGPYLQKILQNLGDLIPDDTNPIEGHSESVTPSAIKNVIASVKHELAPIDPKIRNSLLSNLALTSEEQVTALPALDSDANTNTLQRHAVLRNVDRIGDYLKAGLDETAPAPDSIAQSIAADFRLAGVAAGLSHDEVNERVSSALNQELLALRESGADLKDPAVLQAAVSNVATALYRDDTQLGQVDWQAVQTQNANVISGITFRSSLGAASVGETYLVNLTYKKSQEPVSAVIKLLRPGIAERAIREREVLSGIALLQNEDGTLKHPGQKQTFAGIANQIDTELSLTREYDNVVAGQKYYAGQHEGLEPVKLVAGVPRNRDALALELAPGKTLTDRLHQVRAYSYDTDKPFDRPDDFDPITDTPKLGDQLRNTLSTWLFASLIDNGQREGQAAEGARGFYHGDLHGGNILYKGPTEGAADTDKGTLTLIDFGNATHFPNASRQQLISLLSAPLNPANNGEIAASSFDKLLSTETLENVWEKPAGGKYGNKTARQAFVSEVNAAVAKAKSEGVDVDSFTFLQIVLDTANALNIERPAVVSNFARSLTLLSQQLDDFKVAHKQALKNYYDGFKTTDQLVNKWGYSVEERVRRLPTELADANSLSAKKLHGNTDWQFLKELDQLGSDENFRAELQRLRSGEATQKKSRKLELDVAALSEHLLDKNEPLTPELFESNPKLLDQFVTAYLHYATKAVETARQANRAAILEAHPEYNEKKYDKERNEAIKQGLRTVYTDTLSPGIIELAHDNVVGAQFARDGYQSFGKQYDLIDRGFVEPDRSWLTAKNAESDTHFDFSGTLGDFFAQNNTTLIGIVFGTSTGRAPS